MSIQVNVVCRPGHKPMTTIIGLDNLDYVSILKELKKTLSCNGTTEKNDDTKVIIKLQGDRREDVKQILDRLGIISSVINS